jgi:hypothetical protein
MQFHRRKYEAWYLECRRHRCDQQSIWGSVGGCDNAHRIDFLKRLAFRLIHVLPRRRRFSILAEDTSPMGAKLLIFEPQNFPIRLFSNIYIHLVVLNIA